MLVVTISAIAAAICRVTGPGLILTPLTAAGAFFSAVAYRSFGRRRSAGVPLAHFMLLTAGMLTISLLGMISVTVTLILLTGGLGNLRSVVQWFFG